MVEVPFIGDWHLLSNFQSVLMKVYFDAGLRDLAETAEFHDETLSSLAECSNFKRFILQAWEAGVTSLTKVRITAHGSSGTCLFFEMAFHISSYFFSIRGGMWNLRTARIKTMAPMFTAFD